MLELVTEPVGKGVERARFVVKDRASELRERLDLMYRRHGRRPSPPCARCEA